MVYKDDLSISLSTAYLFNYPKTGFARLPVSLTISLSVFSCRVSFLFPRFSLCTFPYLSRAGGHHPPFAIFSCAGAHFHGASKFHARVAVEIPLRKPRYIERRPQTSRIDR